MPYPRDWQPRDPNRGCAIVLLFTAVGALLVGSGVFGIVNQIL